MKLHKRVLNNPAVRTLIGWIGAAYVKVVHLTGRWTVEKDPEFERLWASGQPFLLCFWHGRLLMMPFIWSRQRNMHMLMSDSRDGQLITALVANFGIHSIAGTRNRGGSAALRKMLRALKSGDWVGITPDGSRGPRMRVSDGSVEIARMAKVPMVPATYSCSAGKFLDTWDRHLVPRPFSRGVFIWGKPVMVDPAGDAGALLKAKQELEEGMNGISQRADRLMDRTPIEPAAAERTDRSASRRARRPAA